MGIGEGTSSGLHPMTDSYRPPTECRCPNSIADEGKCARCGKYIIGRCHRTGVTVPECGCAACAKSLQAKR